jgi:hypothetical protein
MGEVIHPFNVLNEEKKQQAVALGGWAGRCDGYRRPSGLRRETIRRSPSALGLRESPCASYQVSIRNRPSPSRQIKLITNEKRIPLSNASRVLFIFMDWPV